MKLHLIPKSFSFILLLVSMICCSFSAEAQDEISYDKSEFTATVGGIFSGLDYDLKDGKVHNGKMFKVGLGYAYRLGAHFSIGLGVGYQYASGSASFDNLQGAYDATDSEGEEFEFRYKIKDYNENQKVDFLNIPISLQYETRGHTRFYAIIGGKMGIPIQSHYRIKAASLETSGYYQIYDGELFGPKFAGFGDFGPIHTDQRDLDLKMAFSVMLEAGVKQKIATHQSIYLGAFLDYGINGIYDGKKTEQIVEYDSTIPAEFDYNSILGSSKSGKITPLAFGIIIRYGLGF